MEFLSKNFSFHQERKDFSLFMRRFMSLKFFFSLPHIFTLIPFLSKTKWKKNLSPIFLFLSILLEGEKNPNDFPRPNPLEYREQLKYRQTFLETFSSDGAVGKLWKMENLELRSHFPENFLSLKWIETAGCLLSKDKWVEFVVEHYQTKIFDNFSLKKFKSF